IEREFRHPGLFEVRARCSHPEDIQVICRRDAWQAASRPSILEREIGVSQQRLSDVEPTAWHDTLVEAYDCLDAANAHRGRGTQEVTVKRGQVTLPVSPHLQFRTRMGGAQQRDWGRVIRVARATLTPLYEYVAERSRP